MSRYGDNCLEHDAPYGDCIDCVRDELAAANAEVERLTEAMKPVYVEPAENGRDLVMTEPVRERVFALRAEVERLRRDVVSTAAKLDECRVDKAKAESEVERLTGELQTERQRCADVAYDRLMTMGYQLRAADVRADILKEAVRP